MTSSINFLNQYPLETIFIQTGSYSVLQLEKTNKRFNNFIKERRIWQTLCEQAYLIIPHNQLLSADCYKDFYKRNFDFIKSVQDVDKLDQKQFNDLFNIAVEKNQHKALKERLILCSQFNQMKGPILSNFMRIAAGYGHFESVKLLIESSRLSVIDRIDLELALWFSVKNGYMKIAKLLLKPEVLPHINLEVFLYSAVKHGGLEAVRLILDSEMGSHISSDMVGTVLHSAAANKHLEAVRLILASTKLTDEVREAVRQFKG